MGLLSRYLAAGDPFDDRWYSSGTTVIQGDTTMLGPEAALKIATVFRAVNVLAAAVAVLPIDVFRRVARGKKIAETDPWRLRLRRKPNRLQTSYRWRHHMVGHAVLGGNYYAYNTGDQLFPLDPERMRIKDLMADGTLLYEYMTRQGKPELLTQDQVYHLRGFSRDGIRGVSVLELMRDNTQLALLSKRHRRNFTRNEMRPSVVVKHPGDLGDTAKENIQKGYSKAYGGEGIGNILVLDEGMEVESFEINSKNAQWIEGESFQVEEFLRFLGVPGVLVGHADKTATYASAEQFFQSFVTHGLFPWTRNIEQELSAFLYGDDREDTFVEMNLDAMLRPDSSARAAFYRVMVELGIMTRNEAREKENLDPIDGLDEPLTPKNMGTGQEEPPPAPARRQPPPPDEPPPDDEEDAALARARTIVRGAVVRVLRKEALALTGGGGKKGLAERYASDAAGWRKAVREFYSDHVELVSDALQVPAAIARGYCEGQREALISGGIGALVPEAERGQQLERMAMEVS